MISETAQQSDSAWTDSTDPDTAYRQDVLELLGELELDPRQAVGLVEACTGRPFDSCSPMQLVPVLYRLLELLHSARTRVNQRQPWYA